MDLGIKGRRALIYGGSRGIGRAVAGALAAEGADVAVCARKEWAAQKVASEAADKNGVKAKGYRIDAWDEPSTVALISRIMDDLGAIDLLFGVARRPVLEDRHTLSPSCWQNQLDNGFLRFKAVTETLLKGMQDRKWGRILWMLPWRIAGTSAERQLYSVMSAALSAWLETVVADVAKDNVTLNVLKPAPLSRTSGSGTSQDYDQQRPGSNLGSMGETLSVSQVAAVAAFLLSEPAGGICGRSIDLGRGITG